MKVDRQAKKIALYKKNADDAICKLNFFEKEVPVRYRELLTDAFTKDKENAYLREQSAQKKVELCGIKEQLHHETTLHNKKTSQTKSIPTR